MKQFTSLAWKEWREAFPYLLIGLGVFLGLPMIGGLEETIRTHHRVEIETTPWIFSLGGLLAVFVAVGITCRDLSGRIEDFWRSRPVSVSRWMLMKFLIGLAVVVACCTIPILVEDALNRWREDFAFVYFLLNWIGVYSIAFTAGCLIRRTAHAAMFALAAMLLLLFLPLILPPLSWMNVADFDYIEAKHFWQSAQFHLGLVMLGIAVACAASAVLIVRRGWHVESGRRMIYGSISAAILLLVASAAYQIGSNLPVLQEVQFPGADRVWSMAVNGNRVDVETLHDQMSADLKHHNFFTIHHLKLTPTGIDPEKGSAEPTTRPSLGFGPLPWQRQRELLLPDGSRVGYGVQTPESQKTGPLKLWLWRVARDGSASDDEVVPMKLWDVNRDPTIYDGSALYVFDHRLYVIGDHVKVFDRSAPIYGSERIADRLAVIDLADPLNPKLLSIGPLNYRFSAMNDLMQSLVDGKTGKSFLMQLPDIPGITPRQRLDVALYSLENSMAIDGDTLCYDDIGEIAGFKISALTDRTASFTTLGVYKPGLLDVIFGGHRYMPSAQLKNGLLYCNEGFSRDYTNHVEGTMRPSISVFDTRGPHPMRMVGHFAAPDAHFVIPLDDGRALVAGSKLWLIGPPPAR